MYLKHIFMKTKFNKWILFTYEQFERTSVQENA